MRRHNRTRRMIVTGYWIFSIIALTGIAAWQFEWIKVEGSFNSLGGGNGAQSQAGTEQAGASQLPVDDDEGGAGVFDDVRDLGRAIARVDRHVHRAHPVRTEQADDELEAGRQQAGDSVAAGDAERAQAGCVSPRSVVEPFDRAQGGGKRVRAGDVVSGERGDDSRRGITPAAA